MDVEGLVAAGDDGSVFDDDEMDDSLDLATMMANESSDSETDEAAPQISEPEPDSFEKKTSVHFSTELDVVHAGRPEPAHRGRTSGPRNEPWSPPPTA